MNNDIVTVYERRVLFIGEGNFSFSLAVAKSSPNLQIISTGFDSKETLISRYNNYHIYSILRIIFIDMAMWYDQLVLLYCVMIYSMYIYFL